eukprot:scaffold6161_cov158-Amphora_coffeaeformis.AAC.10
MFREKQTQHPVPLSQKAKSNIVVRDGNGLRHDGLAGQLNARQPARQRDDPPEIPGGDGFRQPLVAVPGPPMEVFVIEELDGSFGMRKDISDWFGEGLVPQRGGLKILFDAFIGFHDVINRAQIRHHLGRSRGGATHNAVGRPEGLGHRASGIVVVVKRQVVPAQSCLDPGRAIGMPLEDLSRQQQPTLLKLFTLRLAGLWTAEPLSRGNGSKLALPYLDSVLPYTHIVRILELFRSSISAQKGERILPVECGRTTTSHGRDGESRENRILFSRRRRD